jgi:hypothetical protein
LSAAFVKPVSDSVAEVAPLTGENVVPPSSLRSHWYVAVPLGVTDAVTLKAAAPLDAVWLLGCDVMATVIEPPPAVPTST